VMVGTVLQLLRDRKAEPLIWFHIRLVLGAYGFADPLQLSFGPSEDCCYDPQVGKKRNVP
jgi:hypothetical protein